MSSTPEDAGTGHVDRVADYYDDNTRRFLRVAESPGSDAIHRGVWMPDVASGAAAADTVNRLVVERLRGYVPAENARVLDLGCGVGATMVHLAREIDGIMSGVTISRVQAEIATERFARQGLTERCRVICADFAELPVEPHYDAMVAVEAVVHSPSLENLITSLADRLRPGGRLILCDDWMTDTDRGLAARDRCLDQFRAGWRIGSLHTTAELAAMSESAGLRMVEDLDLTSYLRLGRPRDRVINLVVGAASVVPRVRNRLVEMPFWANMIGGSALQHGLSRGWLEYRLIVLEMA